jgi:prepilin-type N-terminal cleavage/methylation domain-containing protein
MKKGFTLIELVIAIALSSVVFMISGSLIAFMVNNNYRNQRQEAFEQVKNDISIELSNAIRWGDKIQYNSGQMRIDSNEYSLSNNKILKNGSALTPDEVVIDSFEINNYSNDSSIGSYEIIIKMHNGGFSLASDTLNLVVSQRKTDITL